MAVAPTVFNPKKYDARKNTEQTVRIQGLRCERNLTGNQSAWRNRSPAEEMSILFNNGNSACRSFQAKHTLVITGDIYIYIYILYIYIYIMYILCIYKYISIHIYTVYIYILYIYIYILYIYIYIMYILCIYKYISIYIYIYMYIYIYINTYIYIYMQYIFEEQFFFFNYL